ncbi:MAG: MBL fold metallo-hydrolase [Vallitaleaceae bacterium]|jgi:hydroxyacylglutathione hydrolase|nr:MBL fold metallo-hydrolase [Vallitaleaceae bacterium]
MEIITITVGQLETNSYVIADFDCMTCVIVDPAGEGKRIIDEITREGLTVKGILITHGHFDHIGAVNQLATYYEVPVVAHMEESNMMADSQMNYSVYFLQRAIVSRADTFVEAGETISFGGALEFICIEVPGHTANSLCYYIEKERVVFTGDTLMAGAIGRTDFYDGDADTLLNAIRSELMTLPGETAVYPGHGDDTTIITEKTSNPFLLGRFL